MFGKMKASLNQAHKAPILCFVTQSKANRVDKWFDALEADQQVQYINEARTHRNYWKNFFSKELSVYRAAKLRKKQTDSQSQRARDIAKSKKRR